MCHKTNVKHNKDRNRVEIETEEKRNKYSSKKKNAGRLKA